MTLENLIAVLFVGLMCLLWYWGTGVLIDKFHASPKKRPFEQDREDVCRECWYGRVSRLGQGQCRLTSPEVFWMGPEESETLLTAWPIIDLDNDWCGNFQSKESTK